MRIDYFWNSASEIFDFFVSYKGEIYYRQRNSDTRPKVYVKQIVDKSGLIEYLEK